MFFSLLQMPQKMPWFSKVTMRATLCTLVFFFSLPMSLNGTLTTSHKNTEVPNTADFKQKDSTIDSGRDNVVLLSKSIQKFRLTNHSEKLGIRLKTPYGDEILNQRTKIQNDEHNLPTSTSQPERQIIQEEVPSSERERHMSVLIPLRKEVAQKSTKRLNVINTDILPEEKTSTRPLDKLEAAHVSVSRSIQMKHFTSHSRQGSNRSQMLNSKGKTSYNTTKMNTLNKGGKKLTSTVKKPKTKIIPEEATTLLKEQQKPTRRPHTAPPLWIENATELNVSNEIPNTTRADVLPEEKTSMLKAIQVSVSRYMQMQQLAIHSDHPRMLKSKDETSNLRKKREAGDGEHNLTTTIISQKHIMQKEETTPQKEQRNLTKSFNKPYTTSLWMGNATELNGSIKTPNATMVDTVLPKERTSRGPLDMQRSIQDSLTSSNDDKTTNQRTRRTVENNKHNFTAFSQPEKQITEDEVTTPQKEQRNPTKSFRSQHTTSLWMENATKLNGSIKTPNPTTEDTFLPKKRTSGAPLDVQGTIQISLTSSDNDKTTNQRTRMNVENNKHNFTAFSQPEKQITEDEVTTSQKEQRNPTKRFHRQHTRYLWMENATKLNGLITTPNATMVDTVLPKKRTSRAPLDVHGTIQISLTSSDDDKTTNQRTRRNVEDNNHNFTTFSQPKKQITEDEITTPQKEQRHLTKSFHRQHTSLWMGNATKLNGSITTPNATMVDTVLPKERTSRGPLDVQGSILVLLTSSNDDKTTNQRTRRTVDDQKHNFITFNQPEKQIREDEVTTPQKEQKKLTKSFQTQHTTSLWMGNATELNSSIKTPNATTVDTVLTKERTSRGPLDVQASIQVSLTSSNDDKTTNQRTRRTVDDQKHNFTTFSQPEKQISENEVTTPQNEQLRTTEISTRLHSTSSLQTEYVSTRPPESIRADATAIETTIKGHSETQEVTQETSTSVFTATHEVQTNETGIGGRTTKTYGVVPTNQTSKETDQPSTMTHSHTSTITASTKINGDLGTSGVKTTKREVTDKLTKSPKLETPFTTTSTTKKTTPKRSLIPPTSKEKQQGNPGPTVAAVIVTTFFLMFIAIIVILLRKRKMQKRQQENPEWAGPSPFLDGEVQPNMPNMDEAEAINRQRFNEMSFSKYLPNRLSKHLASGRNTSEEVFMGDILQGSTFGRQIPDENQAPNGNLTAAQDPIEPEENKIQEAQASVDSSDTKTPLPGIDSDESKQTDDLTPLPSSGKGTTIKPPPLVSIDLDSLSEEPGTLQTLDGDTVPPAPPLP